MATPRTPAKRLGDRRVKQSASGGSIWVGPPLGTVPGYFRKKDGNYKLIMDSRKGPADRRKSIEDRRQNK